MTARYDTITVTLNREIREDDIQPLLDAIRMLQHVEGVEPGHTDNAEMMKLRYETRAELKRAVDEIFRVTSDGVE